ncbi:MAG: hypothetical protein P8M30_01335 [Planctomycetaceae bacterium]|jgi:hypothetical protein|nr:hypothetical protein [bacterium]MDG2387937.1 hypothetical protein [Planctomycetaceae bacterium]
MSFKSMTRASVLTALFGAVAVAPTSAQYYDPCNTCQPVQPVAQTCYQTVPVTQYVPEKRTVMKPVTEYKNVEQKVTVYKPVTEQRTAEVPQVSYQNVTECRQVSRDMGGWQTAYQPVNKVAPCQYDGRPSFAGWFNRTAYSFRSSFTPNYRTVRSYQPNVVTTSVPTTRQVAVRSTRKVTYNVTKMVPETRTQTVRVPTTRMVAVEETVNVARTVYRTVPTGTAITYGYGGYGYAPQTVLAPSADPISGTRSADSSANKFERTPEETNPIKKSSNSSEPKSFDPFPPDAQVEREVDTQVSSTGGWRPTGSVIAAKPVGPKLIAPTVASNK